MRVCVNCGHALVQTFMFSKAEYYCPGCKDAFGLFDTERVTDTPELIAERDKLDKQFYNVDAIDCVARMSYRVNCPKCHGYKEYHSQHITPEQWQASDAAYARLLGGN